MHKVKQSLAVSGSRDSLNGGSSTAVKPKAPAEAAVNGKPLSGALPSEEKHGNGNSVGSESQAPAVTVAAAAPAAAATASIPCAVGMPARILSQRMRYLELMEKTLQRVVDEPHEFGMPGWDRGSDGGMRCTDKKEMEMQKGVLTHLIKTIGSNLLQGKSVVNISLPVRIFEPRSFLQRITDGWSYAPLYLTRAAFAETALERLQWVMTFAVSGLHRACSNLKPFNPILGETYQARYEDGSMLFLEQVAHHPPTSQFELVGPDKIFYLHGYHEFAANFGPNSLVGKQTGPNVVQFLDGTKISFNLPYVLLDGTLVGERRLTWQGTMKFADEKNNLHCDLVFNPDAKNAFSRLFGSQKTPMDAIRGEIYQKLPAKKGEEEPERKVLSLCEGSWMDGISFDKREPLWAKKTWRPYKPIAVDDPLPSDCSFREDLRFLLAGDQEKAQHWKGLLEDRQRADRDLRKKHAKHHHGHHHGHHHHHHGSGHHGHHNRHASQGDKGAEQQQQQPPQAAAPPAAPPAEAAPKSQ
jgi:hypothetical protein